MRIACWIHKEAGTHSEYLIFLDFSTAIMVARKCLNVTLYVHCLTCFLISIKRLSLIADTECVLCKVGNHLYIVLLAYSAFVGIFLNFNL